MPEDVSKKSAGKGNETEFKTEKPEFRASVPDLKKRNSMLFRNMLGHLDRAKVTLEKQKSQVILLRFDVNIDMDKKRLKNKSMQFMKLRVKIKKNLQDSKKIMLRI